MRRLAGMNERARRQLERTAYHEAGHAVAAYVVHRGNRSVSIIPDESDGTLGHHHSARWGEKLAPAVEVNSRTRE
jgi:ATP-dependent Zn protease